MLLCVVKSYLAGKSANYVVCDTLCQYFWLFNILAIFRPMCRNFRFKTQDRLKRSLGIRKQENFAVWALQLYGARPPRSALGERYLRVAI
jgi:hypothetical protein